VDKKRDFCQDRVSHRGNFLELLLEKSEETALTNWFNSCPCFLSRIHCLLSKLRLSCGSRSNIMEAFVSIRGTFGGSGDSLVHGRCIRSRDLERG
jgi:hypothetical protein